MADKTGIQWTEATWNPIVGCSVVSPGCTNCYAMKQAARIERMTPRTHYAGTTKMSRNGAVWTGTMRQAPDRIALMPLHWKKPRTIFVNSMGDLFHESVPDAWIDRVFAIMALSPQHTFQVLTKRADRMRDYCLTLGRHHESDRVSLAAEALFAEAGTGGNGFHYTLGDIGWHLPNVWLGISAEDQARWDARYSALKDTPAAVRFVSAEPLIGRLEIDLLGIDWVIVGGESGTSGRPMHPDWTRDIRNRCEVANVPFFFKQWGAWKPGSDLRDDSYAVLTDGRIIRPDPISLAAADRNVPIKDRHPTLMRRVGAAAAGRVLDGRVHDGMPGAAR